MNASLKGLEQERSRVEGIPGVGDILKSILSQIFEKLAAMLNG